MMQESINDKGILKCIIMSGIPGAGKTYVSSVINDGAIEARVVNTDKYIELGKDLDTSLLINQNSLALYLNSMLPLIVDSTSSNSSMLFNRVGLLESFGYDVGMIWVNTNLGVALQRAAGRERKVSVDYIHQSYEQSLQNKDYYSSRFGFFYEIDNNEGMLTDKVVNTAFKVASKFYKSPLILLHQTDESLSYRIFDWRFVRWHLYYGTDTERSKFMVWR